MAKKEDIERIAVLVARIEGTDSENERIAATRGAYNRMKRDGVTLDELLGLPDALLYQRGLTELVGYMVEMTEGLSAPAKRALYSELSAKVTARFYQGGQGYSQGGKNDSSSTPPPKDEKKEQYDHGKNTEQGEQGRGFQTTPGQGKQFAKNIWHTFTSQTLPASGHFAKAFFVWAARQPVLAFRVVVASVLFGMGAGIALLSLAGLLHSVLGIGGPWIDMKMSTAWVLVAIPLSIWRLWWTLTK